MWMRLDDVNVTHQLTHFQSTSALALRLFLLKKKKEKKKPTLDFSNIYALDFSNPMNLPRVSLCVSFAERTPS